MAMNKIECSTLKPGQIFTMPVYSEGDNLLLPAFVPLRQKDINLLQSFGITSVSTEGTLLATDAEAVLEPLPQLPKPPPPPPPPGSVKFSITDVQQNSGPYRTYKIIIKKLDIIFNAIKTGTDSDMAAVDSIATQLLQEIRDNPHSYIDYILGGEVSGQELAKSSVNTAILSALTALELKLPNHKIQNIAAGALLHDVGMLKLSKGIIDKKGGLSNAELEQIKSHTLHSSKIITRVLFGSHEVNLVTLQHHERWDGQGYPDGLVGSAIEIGARIVSVADAFEAMVSKKSYRNSLLGYQAVKNLLSDNGRRFDPAVIQAFTRIMGIYPIGSIVKLNDHSVARVVKTHSNAPLRPVVQLIINDSGDVLKPRERPTMDLLVEKTLFIKSPIDPAEFSGEDE